MTDLDNPLAATDTPADAGEGGGVSSIVDTILNLDELLSADVRLAETTARFCTKPWLEADIEELTDKLDGLTDANGNALEQEHGDRALGEAPQDSQVVELAKVIQGLQQEYAAAIRSVRVTQLDTDDWDAFRTRHKQALEDGAPYPAEMWVELVSSCVKEPKMSPEQVKQLRKRIGTPQFMEIASKTWDVNTKSGVSVPKSLLSSHVLRQRPRG